MVVRNAFNKDILREITRTIERFFGIFAIIALGVSFFAGLGTTGVKMKFVENQYLNQHNLNDIRILSNYGLNKQDIQAIRQIDGIAKIQPSYNLDAIVNHQSNALLLKVISVDTEDFYNQINTPELISGRIPAKGNEILVEPKFLDELGVSIGDTITLESGKSSDIRNKLKTNQFKIVGTARSPLYISNERGTGTVGSGAIDCYILVPAENFLMDYYSEAFIQIQGAGQLFTFGPEYETYVKSIVNDLEALEKIRTVERLAELTENAYQSIRRQEEESNRLSAANRVAFDDNANTLQYNIENLETTKRTLESNQSGYAEQLKALKANQENINTAMDNILEGLSEIEGRRTEIASGQIDISKGLSELAISEDSLLYEEEQLYKQYGDYPQILKGALVEIEEARIEISEQQNTLLLLQREIDESAASLDLLELDLQMQKLQLENNLQELGNAEQRLEAGMRSIDTGLKALQANQRQIASGITETEYAKNAALADIALANQTLREARKKLDELKEVDWYILDRDSNFGFLSYKEDSDKISAIGRVFPLIFFLVAALVCLTTMTRLIEEKRLEIGTLKSLGYRNGKILSKYIIYALVPTLTGGLLGGYIGMIVYPSVIMNAYGSLYVIPQSEMYISYDLWLFGIILGAVTTLAATVYTCYHVLEENPSNLLRAKAEQMGKKTFMESISLLWNKLAFSQKITIRNTFKYKKRLWMTILGVGGCTALLLTGFGIHNSIASLIAKQFTHIFTYDVTVSFNEYAKSKDIETVGKLLNTSGILKESFIAKEKSMYAENQEGTEEKITLIASSSSDSFSRFIQLRERESQTPLPLNDSGVVINEKLSKLLDVKTGDTLVLKDTDDKRVNTVVSGICENYFNHYIYISEGYYNEIYKEAAEYNTIYAKTAPNPNSNDLDDLINQILEKKNVSGVVKTQATIDSTQGIMDSLGIVIIVLVISAGMLAFVVLYNLTNINIKEREREIATLIVLGFRDKEAESYIYRENIILTVLGIGFGLIFGFFLHAYIIQTVESRLIMFSREIWPSSYVYAVIMTMIFAFLVNKVTSKKIKNINMIEALKSVE